MPESLKEMAATFLIIMINFLVWPACIVFSMHVQNRWVRWLLVGFFVLAATTFSLYCLWVSVNEIILIELTRARITKVFGSSVFFLLAGFWLADRATRRKSA